MALQIRGETQILDLSITLGKIKGVESGTIMGRSSAGTGAPEALSAQSARENLGLWTDDAVAFGSIGSTNIAVGAGKSLDVSAGTLTLADDQISGDKINGGDISGDLTLSGSTVSVSNALDAGSFASSSVNIDGGNIDGTAIGSASPSSASVTSLIATGGGSSAIDNVPVGSNTASSGAFTSLSASTSLSVNSNLSVNSDGDLTTSGTISSSEVSGANSIAGNLTIGGNLTVNGSTVTVDVATMSVEDPLIALATGNDASDSLDIGFFGLYDSSGSQDLYAGLYRDATDGKFKMFKDSQQADWSTNVVDASATGYSVATLVANLEGDVTGDLTGNADSATALAATKNFSITGDATANAVAFDGSDNVELDLSIDAGAVTFAKLAAAAVTTATDTIAGNDADDQVPTTAAVIDYVSAAVSSGGGLSADVGDFMMYSSTAGKFVGAELKTVLIEIDDSGNALHDVSSNTIELAASDSEVHTDFEFLAEVFINGQKLRYDAYSGNAFDSTNPGDFTIIPDASGDNKKILFNSGILADEDYLEVKYYIISAQ